MTYEQLIDLINNRSVGLSIPKLFDAEMLFEFIGASNIVLKPGEKSSQALMILSINLPMLSSKGVGMLGKKGWKLLGD